MIKISEAQVDDDSAQQVNGCDDDDRPRISRSLGQRDTPEIILKSLLVFPVLKSNFQLFTSLVHINFIANTCSPYAEVKQVMARVASPRNVIFI